MIRTAAGFFIKFIETFKIESINNCVNYANRVVRRNVFINSLRKKERFGWECKDENVTLP